MDSAARYELNGPGNGQISGSGIKQPHGKYSVHRILTPLFPHANELHPVAVADNLQLVLALNQRVVNLAVALRLPLEHGSR